MKLYTNNSGAWAGTQADAKMLDGGFSPVEVPTDKPGLLEFLNAMRVGIDVSPETPATKTHPLSKSADPSRYDVMDAVLNCDRQELGPALGAIVSRTYDVMEDLD